MEIFKSIVAIISFVIGFVIGLGIVIYLNDNERCSIFDIIVIAFVIFVIIINCIIY